jgi:hypothetical protein
MPSYFNVPTYIPQVVTCNSSLDKSFLLEIVDDFKKLLIYFPTGLFPATLTANITFETPAQATETINLSLQGSVVYLYQVVFKERYPANPTSEQRAKINSIWIGIGHPENIIPS